MRMVDGNLTYTSLIVDEPETHDMPGVVNPEERESVKKIP